MKFIEYFVYLILKLLSLLPQRLQFFLGKGLGSVFYLFFKERREIARWNLKKCFPTKNDEEINNILKESFFRIGESLFEFLNAFWASDKKIKKTILNFEEIEELTSKLNPQKGKLLLVMHTPNVDLVVRMSSLFMTVSGMAKEQSIKIIDNLLTASRNKITERIFRPHEGSGFLDSVKNGKACLYAPDQDYGYKNSVFVDFFGHKALTVIFPSILVQRTDCDVYLFTVTKKKFEYKINLINLDLNGEDAEKDLKKINQAIEECVKKNPDNYLWSHRRFKNRPEGEASFYPDDLLRRR